MNVMRYPYNPDKARALLHEAGYPNGFHVSLMDQTRSPEDILANIVQSDWRAVGIDVVLDPTEPVRAFDRRDKLDFEATVVSQGRPADPDLSFSALFYSKIRGSADSGDYINYTAVDKLIEAGRIEQSREKRQQIYDALMKKVQTDLPIIPLSFQAFVAAWRAPVLTMIDGVNNNFLSDTIQIQK